MPRVLTTAAQSSNSPRWSPDGKTIAFLSARPVAGDVAGDTPRTQVWLLPLAGGEGRRLTNVANGVSSFQWSPDGTRLVVVSRSGPSDTAKSPSDVRHYKHANYKFNDAGWFDDKRAHLWVVDVTTRPRLADHERRRLERRRPAVVAGQPEDRVRVGPERQAFDEEPGHRRVGDRRGRRCADEDLRSHDRRLVAALVARRPDDCVRELGSREGPSENLARSCHRRWRRALPATVSI